MVDANRAYCAPAPSAGFEDSGADVVEEAAPDHPNLDAGTAANARL